MRRRLLILLAVVATLALVAWLVPPSRARMTAATTVAEGLQLPSWRPLAPPVTVRTQSVAGNPADVYVSAGNVPVVVLVPGAVPAGRDDPRVQRVATALARADRRVVVPELEVYDERLVAADRERLVDSVLELSDGQPVVLVGISFGGSLALVAAADSRLDGHVAGVATFGAYADLVGVVQAATTGVSVVDGRAVPWDADPRAEQIVRDELTSLLPSRGARAVRAALETSDPAHLPGRGARAVYDILANDRPQRTYPLARDLPVPVRERLAVVSPASVADGLSDVPVIAMHTRDDPVVPYGELLRLGAAIPHAELLTVDSLEHAELRVTSPDGWLGTLADLRTLWSFVSRTLRWQEPAWPWGSG